MVVKYFLPETLSRKLIKLVKRDLSPKNTVTIFCNRSWTKANFSGFEFNDLFCSVNIELGI